MAVELGRVAEPNGGNSGKHRNDIDLNQWRNALFEQLPRDDPVAPMAEVDAIARPMTPGPRQNFVPDGAGGGASRSAAISYSSVLHAMSLSSVRQHVEQARRPFQPRAGRIARHLNPPDSDPAYGVQFAASIGNMACIPTLHAMITRHKPDHVVTNY